LDIKPFHDILLGLFFITIGMMLDWRIIWDRWAFVLFLFTVPVVFKFVLIAALTRLSGASEGISLRTGLYLAQAGEFGFVLLTLGSQNQLIPADWLNPVLASMVLSMLATPFIIMNANEWVMKWSSSDWLQQSLGMTQIAQKSMDIEKHIIICGYGRCGQNLAKLLQTQNVPYMALDLDPDRISRAQSHGEKVVYGDAARLQSLMAVGLVRASAVVVTYLENASAMRVLALTKEHAPHVPVIVRTQDDVDLEKLQAAGAAEVVPETIEGSLMLATHALSLVGVPMKRVIRMVQEQRNKRYALLKDFDRGSEVED
jgi:CPA2 family monovalent cation:H+ antiporter-2